MQTAFANTVISICSWCMRHFTCSWFMPFNKFSLNEVNFGLVTVIATTVQHLKAFNLANNSSALQR